MVVELVDAVEQSVHGLHGGVLVLLALDGVHVLCSRSADHAHAKLGVLAEAARRAQERIALVVVDRATLVALEDVLAAHARVRGHARRAARTLQQVGGAGGVRGS